jgi:hypothetical protein
VTAANDEDDDREGSDEGKEPVEDPEDDDKYDDDEDSDDEYEDEHCGVEALVPGAAVHQALLELTSDGAVFIKIELVE